jgi:beta-lactam-binding protein with PASTA domain
MRGRMIMTGVIAVGAIVGLSACGSSGTTNTPNTPTAATTTQPPTSPAVATPPASSVNSAGQVIVPDAVGKDYQSAQDLWRAAGLHVAPATDATGAHRLPVIDSNWVVLGQSLKAGSTVPRDTFITATVKKYTDS